MPSSGLLQTVRSSSKWNQYPLFSIFLFQLTFNIQWLLIESEHANPHWPSHVWVLPPFGGFKSIFGTSANHASSPLLLLLWPTPAAPGPLNPLSKELCPCKNERVPSPLVMLWLIYRAGSCVLLCWGLWEYGNKEAECLTQTTARAYWCTSSQFPRAKMDCPCFSLRFLTSPDPIQKLWWIGKYFSPVDTCLLGCYRVATDGELEIPFQIPGLPWIRY